MRMEAVTWIAAIAFALLALATLRCPWCGEWHPLWGDVTLRPRRHWYSCRRCGQWV